MSARSRRLPASLDELRSLLEAEGGPLAEALAAAPDLGRARCSRRSWPAAGATSSGPARVRAARREHPRGLPAPLRRAAGSSTTADPDLRLLAGDHLYAFGLVRLASIGDLEAVDELADLISLCAQAHAAADDRRGAARRGT